MARVPLLPFLAAALFGPQSLHAQLAFGGRPYGIQYERRQWSAPPEVAFPAVDAAAAMAQDEARWALGQKGPYRFGITHTTDLSLLNSGSWTVAPNGDRVWRLALRCPDAKGINLLFTTFDLPAGGQVFLYNDHGTVRGAFTAASAPRRQVLGTAPVPGERITVEYVEPANAAGQGHLVIGQVVHAYRDLFKSGAKDFGDGDVCHVNTICPEGDDWRPEIRSVARIIAGGGYCTGTLVNNCANDSTPYLLTARHCLNGETDLSGWVFQFNWESPTCDPSTDAPLDHSITGGELLAQNAGTDMAFVRLSSTPPPAFQPFYGGWNIGTTAPTSATCIHHPVGDIKKISHTEEPLGQDAQDLGSGVADCWWVHAWASGTTEPGSSGSALWDQDHLIVGQLYGGAADCLNPMDDYFGRFDLSYPQLQQWLGTCGEVLPSFDPSAIIPPIPNAAVTSIYGVPLNLCNVDSIRAGFTLKNNGDHDLTTVTVHYTVSTTGVTGSWPWTGVLHPLQTTNVALPALAAGDGPGTLTIYTTGPNNLPDTDLSDDTLDVAFVAGDPGEIITLDLHLDQHGTETTWTLRNDQGTLLYAGGPYQESTNGYTVTTDFCLAHDCYTFTIEDDFGDGICCGEGQGHYTIADSAGVAYVIGNGQFDVVHTDTFCASAVGLSDPASPDGITVLAEPGTGAFMLTRTGAAEEELSLALFEATGRLIWSGRIPNGQSRTRVGPAGLAPGTYVIVAASATARTAQRLVMPR